MPSTTTALFGGAAPAVADGRIRPVVGATLPFDTAAEAAGRLRSHRARGKTVLTVP
ncbi:zinc-binding dehydrogenase [Streptomyces sp. NPDC059134]|uniref:zinc-binding dehydrogenase n=1 Tax=Streptomyces sp. NPDC059134 TaxID=3346738 RepID=UPI0036BC4B8B